MKNLSRARKLGVAALSTLCLAIVSTSSISAAPNSTFNQTINPGILSVDIVDAGYVAVGSPSVTFPAATFSFSCQTNTSALGTATQQLYVKNPDAADNGWTLSIAGSAPTAVWDGAASDYDFNDSTGAGCTDGVDADSVGGQLTVNPAAGTLALGSCNPSNCTTSNITKGSSTAFVQGTTDSITLLTAAAGSSDIGDWTFQGIGLSQTIPAEQAAASDYDINVVLSVVAN